MVSIGSAHRTEKHRLLTYVKYIVNELPSLFRADSRSPATFPRSHRLVRMSISLKREKSHRHGVATLRKRTYFLSGSIPYFCRGPWGGPRACRRFRRIWQRGTACGFLLYPKKYGDL